jgi:hypothetical protein
MSIKQKFESIDQSQLSENQKEILGKIKTATKDFTITDQKALEKVDGALDNIITKLKATNPQAIKGEAKKREPKAKKEVTKKPAKSETKKPKEAKKEAGGKRTIFSIAKEIRKADESWDEAKKRAKKVMETEKEDTTKKMKSETDKLLSFIKRRKELEGLSGTSVKKDSKIEALPKGRRISKKGWKNQHGESEGGKVYYENRDNRTDRLAPNFADKIYLADGGYAGGGYVVIAKSEKGGGFVMSKPTTKVKAEKLKSLLPKIDGETNEVMTIGKASKLSGLVGKEYLKYADGGAIIGTPENPLARNLGISYTGLVGETGAMSSGEMFADGGLLTLTPETPLGRDLGIDYTGLVGETGAMSSGEMFEDGGKVKFVTDFSNGDGIQVSKEKTEDGKIFYTAFVTSYPFRKIVPMNEDKDYVVKRAKKIYSDMLEYKKNEKFEQGGSLVDGYLTDPNFGDFQAGVYEMGGATGLPAGAEQSYINYYLNEGATAGMYKKGGAIPNNYEGRTPEDVWNSLSKKQRGHFLYDHVSEIEEYKNIERLATSEIRKAYNSDWSSLDKDIKNRFTNHIREGQYAYGGRTRERKYINYSQKHEVRYSKDKPKRRGYGYADGGMIYKDLFEDYENQPAELSEIVSTYMEKFEEDDYDYEDSKKFLAEVEGVGYTFDYGLDNEPYGLRPIGVKLNQIEGYEYADGGTIDAFQMRTVRGIDNMPTEILTDEQKVQFAKGGSIKNEDIKVGEEFWLSNGDVIEIVRLFKENIDEDWVEYKRNGEKKENSVKELRLFINRLSGKKQKSLRERRNEYLEKLGQKESDVWDKIGAESGSEIRNSDKTLKAYAEGVEEMLQKEGVGKGSFDQEDYDFYTDLNWHLFNDFLVWNNYYDPEMTKNEKAWREKMYNEDMREKGKSTYTSNPSIISLSGGSKSKSNNYVAKAKISTITIVKDGKEIVLSSKDVLNGVNLYDGGGKLKNDHTYFAKRYVKEVITEDGDKLKPSNGYWVKKSALKDSKKEEYKVMSNQAIFPKRGVGTYWYVENLKGQTINKNTGKPYKGKEMTNYYFLNEDGAKNFAKKLNDGTFFMDGGKTTFKQKATAIAKNFEGKKVKPKYQKEYGKTYDKAEAKEVGNKIAGSQKAKYDSKMSGGGKTKRGGAMQLAKQIRKDGESWQSALKRANEQVRNK